MTVMFPIPHITHDPYYSSWHKHSADLVYVSYQWAKMVLGPSTLEGGVYASPHPSYMFSVRTVRLAKAMRVLRRHQSTFETHRAAPYILLRGVLPAGAGGAGDGDYTVIALIEWPSLPEGFADLSPTWNLRSVADEINQFEASHYSNGDRIMERQCSNALMSHPMANPYGHQHYASSTSACWSDMAGAARFPLVQAYLCAEWEAQRANDDIWGFIPAEDTYETAIRAMRFDNHNNEFETQEGNVMPNNIQPGQPMIRLYCSNCGDRETVPDGDPHDWVLPEGDYGSMFCPSCIESGEVGECDDIECDRFGTLQAWYDDESGEDLHLCAWCYERVEQEANGDIHYYSYKPTLEFMSLANNGGLLAHMSPLGNNVYMGMELELEVNDYGKRGRAAKIVASHEGRTLICKEDGSLNCGIEVVSQPMTLDVWQNSFDWGWTSKLADMGCRAWNTQTAGLHIHVGITSFSDRSHFARFYMLFMRNSEQWIKLAGRDSSRWATFHDHEDKGAAVKRAFGMFPAALQLPQLDLHGMTPRQKDYAIFERDMFLKYHPNKFLRPGYGATNYGRYVALNCQNAPTVELRFWRPSLKATTVLAALEATTAAVEYTRGLKVLSTKDKVAQNKGQALSWDAFHAWLMEPDQVARYPHALARIAGRVGGDNPTEVPTTQVDRNH